MNEREFAPIVSYSFRFMQNKCMFDGIVYSTEEIQTYFGKKKILTSSTIKYIWNLALHKYHTETVVYFFDENSKSQRFTHTI